MPNPKPIANEENKGITINCECDVCGWKGKQKIDNSSEYEMQIRFRPCPHCRQNYLILRRFN